MNYQTLKAELSNAVYAGATDQQAAYLLNDNAVATNKPIETRDIQQYLMLLDKLMAIEASVEASAQKAVRAMQLFDSFDMANQAVSQKLASILDGLIIDSLLSATDKVNILSMGDALTSKAQQLGLSAVKVGDVQFARGL